jgi:hypothetical protein
MSKQVHKPGTFVRIPLADGSFGYGRFIESSLIAFYSYRTTSPDPDLGRIAANPVLFKIPVRQSWEVIGWRELEEHLTQPAVFFMQDVGNFKSCTIADSLGNEREATPEECIGLERVAVWEQHAAEERLLDAFLGRPNADVERLRVRLR